MKKTVQTLALVAMITLAIGAAGAAGTAALYGNSAAKADAELTIEDMLRYAVQDEYLARGEYYAIMKKYGSARPFSNIVQSEEYHVSLLKAAFEDFGIAFPADESAKYLVVPGSLLEAFKVGVQAEIDNIAMYDRFLASPLLKEKANEQLVTLFGELRAASQNHLRAFQNQVARY